MGKIFLCLLQLKILLFILLLNRKLLKQGMGKKRKVLINRNCDLNKKIIHFLFLSYKFELLNQFYSVFKILLIRFYRFDSGF